jgi:glycosyltransferase involved in cell wall biosynthesis
MLAASGDSASFASKIRRLLDDAGLRKRLGTAARRAVEASFSDARIARMSLDHYQSVIDGTGVRKAEAECTGDHRERL